MTKSETDSCKKKGVGGISNEEGKKADKSFGDREEEEEGRVR